MTSKQRKTEQACARMAAEIERLQNHYAQQGTLCDDRCTTVRRGRVSRLARATDKQTSHEGAADVAPRLNDLHREFWVRCKRSPDSTAQEIASGNESLRKRAKELVDAGRLIESGRRKCRRTGRAATTYRIA